MQSDITNLNSNKAKNNSKSKDKEFRKEGNRKTDDSIKNMSDKEKLNKYKEILKQERENKIKYKKIVGSKSKEKSKSREKLAGDKKGSSAVGARAGNNKGREGNSNVGNTKGSKGNVNNNDNKIMISGNWS